MKNTMIRGAAFALVFAGMLVVESQGQVVINTTGSNIVTENFNSFAGSLVTIPTSNGFSVNDDGATSWGFQAVGTGTSNTGGIYAYGTSGENAFGFLRSSTRAGGLQFTAQNNTGSSITEVTFAWDFEQWRYAGNASGFSVTGVGELSSLDFSSVDFSGAATGTNGTVSVTPATITFSSLNITDGQTFGLRWDVTDLSGAENGVAIDNFSLSAIPEPSSALLLVLGGVSLALLRRRR